VTAGILISTKTQIVSKLNLNTATRGAASQQLIGTGVDRFARLLKKLRDGPVLQELPEFLICSATISVMSVILNGKKGFIVHSYLVG
jgi:hypothetical protein